MATGAAGGGDALFRGIFEACISGGDSSIQQRPYHRNCSCALHKSRGRCHHDSRSNSTLTYPIRKSWSETCLTMIRQSNPSGSGATSPVAPGEIRRTPSQAQLLLEKVANQDDMVAVPPLPPRV